MSNKIKVLDKVGGRYVSMDLDNPYDNELLQSGNYEINYRDIAHDPNLVQRYEKYIKKY
jgi:hypothetical protein